MLRKKRGMAIIEFLFFFFVFIFFFALMYGSWGITHSAILSSIGARAYAWDVIRNRSNLTFVRDDGSLQNNYWKKESRVFTVTEHKDNNPTEDFKTRKLKIDMGGADWSDNTQQGFTGVDVSQRQAGYDQKHITTFKTDAGGLALEGNRRNRENSGNKTGVVHLMMAYGICLNSECDSH